MSPQNVLDFWFKEAGPEKWFSKDANFDALARTRFLNVYHAAMRGETASWRDTPRGRLAEILVLDQFPRNMFRGSGDSFAGDARALSLAQEAVALGEDKHLSSSEKRFLYMPYMHSESRAVHKQAFWLFLKLGDWTTLKYEWKHKRIIDRFGRYPYRNELLGRESTSEEIEWLKTNKGF